FGPELRQRGIRAQLEPRRADAGVGEDLEAEFADRLRRKNDRRDLGEAASLDRQRKGQRFRRGAGDPLQAGDVLGDEVEIAPVRAMLSAR
ncbi:MAG: hypothetical protein ACJ8CQ_08430, partial [Microvirga sp.]